MLAQIPAGMRPGDQFQVRSPATGQLATCVVPPGAAPGQTIRVELPPVVVVAASAVAVAPQEQTAREVKPLMVQ